MKIILFTFLSLCCRLTGIAQQNENTKDLTATMPLSYFHGKHVVAFYPFSGNAKDISGNKNNPSFNNATLVTDRFGNKNSAYSFDGTQYIKGSCTKYPGGSFTISFWFKIEDLLSRHQSIMGYGGNTCGTSVLILFNERTREGAYRSEGHCAVNSSTTSNGYPPTTDWNNFIITSDIDNTTTKFYLNGVLLEKFENTAFKNTYITGKEFAFGTIPGPDGIAPFTNDYTLNMTGSLDDIIIFDRALNSRSVDTLYQSFKNEPSAVKAISSAELSVSLAKPALYPNPSTGKINIQYNYNSAGKTQIKVFDLAGKIVFTKTAMAMKGNNIYNLDLSHLKQGMYYLELTDGNEQTRTKFIIQK
ncbi:MAG TPA: T9SS type A sorting domain-containing protein [Panacibacter sp.]|nr:T9SS type A sorting domain-containing protein [Panacibacter sp.]